MKLENKICLYLVLPYKSEPAYTVKIFKKYYVFKFYKERKVFYAVWIGMYDILLVRREEEGQK